MSVPARDPLPARLRACARDKVAVCLGLAVGICVPYWTLQRVALAPPLELSAGRLDELVAFEPAWTPVYLSIAALVPLAVWLQPDRDALRRYAWGLAALCVPSFAAFALLPVAGPRPEAIPDAGLYALLVSADRPTNSMPSLHAGLTVYSLMVIDRVRSAPRRRAWHWAGWVWGAGILFATIATKQHWAVDLAPGALLGAAAAWLSWRGRPRRADA